MRPLAGVRFAVYASGEGAYFLREIRHLLACGLRATGAEVRETDERKGFASGVDWHLIVAPQEFLTLGNGARLRTSAWPPGVILYNGAQPGSPAFSFIRRFLPRAHAVWDLDFGSAKQLAREGWRASHVPLGWVQDCRLFAPTRTPHDSKPLDVLFVGSRTPRRERFFRAATPALTGVRVLMHTTHSPPRMSGVREASRRSRMLLGLARRAKIVLNIHRRDSAYFEWHRIVLHGLAQGALVVSEPTTAAPPLRPGRDFVTAPLDKIPGTILHHLTTPRGRKEAAAIARQGGRTYRRSCRLPDILAAAVKTLARADHAKARRARRRERAASSLLGD
ncbi:MAG: hypothetical protein A2506_07080 [Elusimicrobia bacterium RIFOXYD12_FULL_66_9]|nr:MAG: hypothetical protein A2506_07080 [Elusimicrobia bacterium RIFOXYD12_FULL_66_9]